MGNRINIKPRRLHGLAYAKGFSFLSALSPLIDMCRSFIHNEWHGPSFTDGWLLVILAACRYTSTAIVGEKGAVKLGEKQHYLAKMG